MAKRASARKTKGAVKKPVKKSTRRKSTIPKVINFEYIKSNQFRVIRVDGVHGGICPKGDSVQMAFFSERLPIPKKESYKLEGIRLGERIAQEGKTGVVREVEVEALMGLETAKVFANWLKEKIELLESIEKQK